MKGVMEVMTYKNIQRTLAIQARFAVLAIFIGLIALCATNVHGQAISGDLVGTVTDPSGAVVPNATVVAKNTGTLAQATVQTNQSGDYRFVNLPVGKYDVTVTGANLSGGLGSILIELNRTATANIVMKIGAATVVEVQDAAATIDTTTAQLQSTYGELAAQDLGVTSSGGTGAGVLNLSLLSSGVTQASAMGLGTGPSVGGQRPRNNNFTIEGVDNNNKTVTGALATIPNDAVQSFSLLQNQFSPEFGHSSGGQFNTVIKGGTNNFHGSLYEYFRNRNLNAEDQIYKNQNLTQNPRFDSNRYGGTIGGPILKSKLFFFTDFERQPVGLTGTPGPVKTPTAAGLAAIGATAGVSAQNFGIFKKYVPVAAAQDAGECIAIAGAPAAGTCPAGQVPIGTVSIAPPAWQNFLNFVQSVDFNISDRDQLRGRYIYNKRDEINSNANLAAFFTSEPFRWHVFTLSEYHTFTPSVANEFRVGFNRYANTILDGDFKYPGLDAFPNITLNDLGSGLNIGPDPNAPQFNIQNLYQVNESLSWNKGNHNLKFGIEGREYIAPQQFTQRKRGDYIYNSTDLFLKDISPDHLGERSTGALTYYGNQSAIYWYANDSWRINPNLSLNLGVRYEYTGAPQSESRQTLNSLVNTPSLIVPQVNQPLVFNAPQTSKNNWAPRVGIAYSPGSSGNTSIRAGFGLAYDVLYDNIGSLAVPPQVGATSDVNLTSPTPGFLAGGGLRGGGSGIQVLDKATAAASTSNWMPPNTEWPYSIQWNLGIQHSFAKNYTAEVRYVGTRGIHLDVQTQINRRALVDSQHFLPTFLQAPSQAQLDSLTTNLASLKQPGSLVPAFAAAGFTSTITADLPTGSSIYHGLQTELNRRFSNGLMLQAAYTWSHTIDDSTADFHSTDLTPRRQQDAQNLGPDRGTSALSRTHRFSLAMVYDLPYFKQANWFIKNLVGNWEFSPVYVYESPEFASLQSGLDSNLNNDSAGDRVILNSGGVAGTGSGVTALCNSNRPTTVTCGTTGSQAFIVGYQAKNPNARYILAGAGALANVGRNTLPTSPTNNIDLALYKDLSLRESVKLRFGAQISNVINHPQFIPGSNPGQGLGVNDVASFNTASSNYISYLTPGSANFNNPKAIFASNARSMALQLKLTF